MIDLAYRAHSHNYNLDPIVRSLLDTDFYKLLMHQMIFLKHKDVDVTFALKNRSNKVLLGNIINETELRAQLDHARTLRFQNNELIWLEGNRFYNTRNIFKSEYIEYLRTFRLPPYQLTKNENNQYELEFQGKWLDTTLWEIPALTIMNTLRNRAAMKGMSKLELDIFYSAAKTKLWQKLTKLKELSNLNLTDFGTRRRHDFLYQEWAVICAQEVLGNKFTGTSNALIAMRHGIDAKGTNAHELPMTLAALANSDINLKNSQYDVLKEWQEIYGGALLVALPDTFGTTQFLKNAPKWVEDWTGFRFDSKDPEVAGEEVIEWWQNRGINPKTKLGIFSDGLDVDDIIRLYKKFDNRMKIGFGWGTLLTNDFRGCHPRGLNDLDPISLVCKVKSVNGKPAVKLSDNYNKATGAESEIERYREIFGNAGINGAPVIV